MHEALIASKLLYALEAIPIPEPMYDRIDASYYKGLRQIMNFKTTFGQQSEGKERTNTNELLIEKINIELTKVKKGKEFIKISTRIKERAIKLLGKTIRRNDDDPIKEVIMNGDTWNIPQKGDNRVGRPATNWLIETANLAWDKHEIYKHNLERIKRLGIIHRNKERRFKKATKKEATLSSKRLKKRKNHKREARGKLKEHIETWERINNKEKYQLLSNAFTKKELGEILKLRPSAIKKANLSTQYRNDLRDILDRDLFVDTTTREVMINKAFSNAELYNKCIKDMTDSTLKMMLKRHEQKDRSSTQYEEEDIDHNNNPHNNNEKQQIKQTLNKYQEEDNESPETETDSQIDTNDMSGSEEEIIDYAGTQINREDLPKIEFDYKSREHVEKIIEAAKSHLY